MVLQPSFYLNELTGESGFLMLYLIFLEPEVWTLLLLGAGEEPIHTMEAWQGHSLTWNRIF